MKPVVTIGETMGLFRAATAGSLSDVLEFELGIGGAESNVAIGLSRLGMSARWLGRIGDDPLGTRVTRTLQAEGVDTTAIVDDTAATGMMIKELAAFDSRQVIYYRSGSAGSRLAPEDIAKADIPGAALLHVTGITPALSQSAHDAIQEAIRVAKLSDVPVSFDVNHRASLWRNDDYVSVYRDIACRSTIVFAGEDEARILAPTANTPIDLGLSIRDLGPKQVIIKLGEKGCVAVIDGDQYRRPAFPVRVIDTVGAGDAFVAGYLAALLSAELPDQRLHSAVRVGAHACLHIGDWEGFPTHEELSFQSTDLSVEKESR